MAPMAVGGARHGETDGQDEEPMDKMLIWGIGCKRKAPWRWRRAGSSKQHGTVECRQPHDRESGRWAWCNSNVALLLSFESLLQREAKFHDACGRCGCPCANGRGTSRSWGLSDARACALPWFQLPSEPRRPYHRGPASLIHRLTT